MPVFYNYTENGVVYAFDDVFVPADAFREGNLFTWGRNTGAGQYAGALGNNTTINRSTPVTTFAGGTNWKQVSGGTGFTVAIKIDGTLWTWGQNARGQLGDNTTTARSTPVTTFAGGNNWKQVSCVGLFTGAIKTDGTLWTWGYNYNGQLGDNTVVNRSTPVTTFAGGTNWKQVACGYFHMASIKTDGTLWTWGNNYYGELGDNTSYQTGMLGQRLTPVTTFAGGTNWKQVVCNGANGNSVSHTRAIKTDGTLWTWGNNNFGQLGDNTIISRSTPVTTFAGGTNWKQVAGGETYTAAIKTDGTLWSWGRNDFGNLGINNTTTPICTPVTTFAGGTNWKQVAGGSVHTAAIKTDGTLWTWGLGTSGQLGINLALTRCTPVTTFAGGTNWKQVAGGSGHTAAVTYIDSYQ